MRSRAITEKPPPNLLRPLTVAFLVRQRAEVAVRRRSGLGLVIAGPGRIRDELHGALSRRLGSVVVAADSVAGLGLAISEQPEAVLIDDPLPTMSGLDTSYLVRAYAPGTRVVLFTTDRRSVQLAELNGIFTSTPAISRRQLFKALDEALAA